MQLELGLDLYDHGSRFFDPALGRWHAIDPQDQFDSPYTGLGNNPINGIDPDGEYFWEKKHIRQARKFAKLTGGNFDKNKGRATVDVSGTSFAENSDADALAFEFEKGDDRSGLLNSAEAHNLRESGELFSALAIGEFEFHSPNVQAAAVQEVQQFLKDNFLTVF